MIYSNSGCPVEVVSRFDTDDGATLIQARIAGPYPDGSGADRVGKLLHASDRTAKGWFPPWDLRADEGIREIQKAIDATPPNPSALSRAEYRKIFKYYGMAV